MGEDRLTRDRDERGRPRNARPRDSLGRPLERGADAEQQADPDPLPPAAALRAAQSLLDQGAAFRAHEVLESVWKTTSTDRELWRGLAQIAVALTHRQRGNRRGAATLFARAAQTLAPYAGRHPFDVDISALVEWLDGVTTDPEADDVPRLVAQRSGG